jgi:hypothetical protein
MVLQLVVTIRRRIVNTFKVFLIKSESGFGLAEVLIAGAIGTALIAGLSVGLRSLQRNTSKSESTMDLLGIKSRIISSVDCTATLPAPCADGAYIPLLNAAGTQVVGAGGTTIGKFTVRGRCVNGGGVQGIDVRAAWLSSAGMANSAALDFNSTNSSLFRADEGNVNLPYSWNHPKAFLIASAGGGSNLLCGAGGALVPPGGIIIWSGPAASIPPGWALCDGSAGTPNLSDRFIVGAGPNYGAAGTPGGTTNNSVSVATPSQVVSSSSQVVSFTLTAAQMPSHTHATTFDGKGFANDSGPQQWHAAGVNQSTWTTGWRVLRTEYFSMSAAGGGSPVALTIPPVALTIPPVALAVPIPRPNYYTVAFIMKL